MRKWLSILCIRNYSFSSQSGAIIEHLDRTLAQSAIDDTRAHARAQIHAYITWSQISLLSTLLLSNPHRT